MESLSIAIKAVMPFIVYLFVGAILKRSGKADEQFFRKLNQVAFMTFFPMVLFRSIYHINPAESLSVNFILFAIGFLIVATVILCFTVPLFVKDNRQRGVVVQGIIRGNTLLFALPLAQAVYGDASANQAGVAVAFIVPLYNIISVIVLTCFSEDHVPNMKDLLLKVIKNPIIIGAMIGFLCFLSPVKIPGPILKPINDMASMATPAAVIALGGTISPDSVKKGKRILIPSLTVRFFVIPLILLLLSLPLRMSGFERFLLMVLFMTPTAAASFPMAVSMGADGELAGEFVVVSTIASIGTIFLWITALGHFGFM